MENVRKVDIFIDIVILTMVTYYVADTLSNGEFSRELGNRFVKLTSRIKTNIERRKSIERDTGRVIWDAIETVEDRNDDLGDAQGI
jgi:hypothetical protein